MIYVLNSKGESLMPTVRHGKRGKASAFADKKAFIVNYHPFTIQLTKEEKYLNSGSFIRY